MNIKNNDQKCFPWCHIRHINLLKILRERITLKRQKLFQTNTSSI